MYLALYRKWRPKSFEDVIGQPHITLTLKQEVLDKHTAHAYLLTGPRGTGKTTCSKILAMAINCLNPVDGNPCMECDNCRGIEHGSVLDVVEIDAASNNGVDDVRRLREEASFTPAQCLYRVYIIDEVHMLSVNAFNALLKIMEEPPAHVVFILATTEAHKVPATILSRCQRFDFRRIRAEDIAERIASIARSESVNLNNDAAIMLARLADGGMRDALSLLDQCIAYSSDVTPEVVINAIGIIGNDHLYELTDAIVASDATSALLLVDKLYGLSKDLFALLEELVYHFRNIMLVKTVKDPSALVAARPDEMERLKSYAQQMPTERLLTCMTQLQNCLDGMARSIDRRLALELCLMRLCTGSTQSPVESPASQAGLQEIIKRIERIEANLAAGIPTRAAAPVADVPQVERITTVQTPENADAPLVPLMEWAEILDLLSETNKPLWGTLHGSTASVSGDFLYIENALSLVSDMLRRDNNASKLVAAVFERTGKKYRVRVKRTAQRETSADDGLNSLLNRAKEMGIQINEEG